MGEFLFYMSTYLAGKLYPSPFEVWQRCIEGERCCCCHVYGTSEGTHCSKASAIKLSTIVNEYVRRDAVSDKPTMKDDICNVRYFCLGS